MEWYDPSAITTKDGSLVITLSKQRNHDRDYMGGMMSTWNKFCFTGGLIETNVMLPGSNNIHGLWPAVWTMGNLGECGFINLIPIRSQNSALLSCRAVAHSDGTSFHNPMH
jgi:beta-glucan synthesis-associated protein KRE6